LETSVTVFSGSQPQLFFQHRPKLLVHRRQQIESYDRCTAERDVEHVLVQDPCPIGEPQLLDARRRFVEKVGIEFHTHGARSEFLRGGDHNPAITGA